MAVRVQSNRSAASGAKRALLEPPMAPALYPPLPRGRRGLHGPSAEEAAANQRARLSGTLVQVLSERGYGALRTRELCERSGVSTRDLYKHFKGGVHECFMAVFEQVSDALLLRVAEAWEQGQGPPQRMERAVKAFAEAVAAEPAASRLALCEPFAAGPRAHDALVRVEKRLQKMLILGFEMDSCQISPLLARATIAGLGSVARSHLLDRAELDPRAQGRELADWSFSCLRAPLPASKARPADVPIGYRPSAILLTRAGRYDEPEGVRILAATAALAAEHGYAGLSERAIRQMAHVTCGQFKAMFASEHEAFTATLEVLWTRAYRHAAANAQSIASWPRRLKRTIEVVLQCLAADPTFVRLAFAEQAVDGASALRSRESLIGGAARRLAAATPPKLRPSPLAARASIAACWAIIEQHAEKGEAWTLPAQTGTLTSILLGASVATRGGRGA